VGLTSLPWSRGTGSVRFMSRKNIGVVGSNFETLRESLRVRERDGAHR